MITIRRSEERGHSQIGWLDSYHTFSFAEYYDPRHMHFSDLRVINEDVVAPGQGFGTHPHRNMEIITVVLDGALQHRDSMGTGSVITAGMVQRMSAGTGIQHSEFNASSTDPVHLLQIWIIPETDGIEPSYEEKTIGDRDRKNEWQLLVSQDGREGSLKMHQDAQLMQAFLTAGQEIETPVPTHRQAWLQVVSGTVNVNGQVLSAGDAAGIKDEPVILTAATDDVHVLLFDMKRYCVKQD